MEENFGGKKLWQIWRINSNLPKFFFAKIFDCSLFHFVNHDLQTSVCGMSFWKKFEWVQIILCDPIKGAIVCLDVPHLCINCICMAPKGVSISETMMCSCFALGFTLVSTTVVLHAFWLCHASISSIADVRMLAFV